MYIVYVYCKLVQEEGIAPATKSKRRKPVARLEAATGAKGVQYMLPAEVAAQAPRQQPKRTLKLVDCSYCLCTGKQCCTHVCHQQLQA